MGGDIDIDPEMVLMQHSQIIANAYEGNGGNIHIVADHFIQSADSIVQASSEYGFDGNIFIDAPDARIGNELVTLPSNYLDASQWLHTPCSLRTSKDVSRLVISGRDAIPSTVEDLYMSPALTFLADEGADPLRAGEIEADFFKGL
jgi:large exoprotein involved in heme utilization and adhesion